MARTRLQPLHAFDQLTSVALRDPELPHAIPMDAFRRNDRFIIQFDLPGVDPSSVVISYQRNMLQIRAERRVVRERGDEVSLTECPQGLLTRQLFLDESLDPRRLTAHFDRGVVTVLIPITRRSKPEQIRLADTGQAGQLHDPDAVTSVAPVPQVMAPQINGRPPAQENSLRLHDLARASSSTPTEPSETAEASPST